MTPGEDIYDIMPLPTFPWEPSPVWWGALCAALLLGLLFFLGRRRSRPSRGGSVVEIALLELQKIERNLSAAKDLKSLLFLASARVRQCFSSLTGYDWLSQAKPPQEVRDRLNAPLQEASEHLAQLEQLRFASKVEPERAREILDKIHSAFERARGLTS